MEESTRKVLIRKLSYFLLAFINIAVAISITSVYMLYTSKFETQLYEENIANISNLNTSAANNATMQIDSWHIKLLDLVHYIEHSEMSYEEALEYIGDSNTDSKKLFELIAPNYKGYLAQKDADGNYIALDYTHSSYSALKKSFDDVNDEAYTGACYTSEFTNKSDGLKYFALYKHLTLVNKEGKSQRYTLLLAVKSVTALAALNVQNEFDGQSSVLLDTNGNYMVGGGEFQSVNLYQYLYLANDLTLDQKLALQAEVENNTEGSGLLKYKNSAKQDCVFSYIRMTNNWYCVTCVPL